MDAIEPLISSSVMGPLGIAHLPRLWLKILLHGLDLLPEGYRAGDGGFDGALFERLGIDGAAFVAFVNGERPDYLALERWVLANARDLGPVTIAGWNASVRSAKLPAARAEAWRARFGIVDQEFTDGVNLNDLDDWAGIHARLANRATTD